ncbi:unnamed protein product [Effrenium voratum]|nr:unnamed protein product [Effrenium voratum]
MEKKRARSESSSSTSSSSRRRKKKKKKKKKAKRGVKAEATKELSAVFGNTGMDPDVKVRRQVVRKVKKSLRLLQRQMDTSDRDSSGEELTEEEDAGVFEEAQRIRRVGVRGPGVLAAASINEMKKSLVAASGQLWGQNRDLAPVGVHYFRTVLQLKLHGAMAREAFTLAYGADLLAQGTVAEAIDLLLQRLKSLEQVSQGMPWQTAQKMELCPLETAQDRTMTEEDETLDHSVPRKMTENGGRIEVLPCGMVPLPSGRPEVEAQKGVGEIEVHRLIMNLIPLNRICRGIEGDIATLPSWSSMGPLSLDIDEAEVQGAVVDGVRGVAYPKVDKILKCDLPEPFDFCGVVTIGLFDGIGALRVAAEASRLPLLGHIAVEKNAEARYEASSSKAGDL